MEEPNNKEESKQEVQNQEETVKYEFILKYFFDKDDVDKDKAEKFLLIKTVPRKFIVGKEIKEWLKEVVKNLNFDTAIVHHWHEKYEAWKNLDDDDKFSIKANEEDLIILLRLPSPPPLSNYDSSFNWSNLQTPSPKTNSINNNQQAEQTSISSSSPSSSNTMVFTDTASDPKNENEELSNFLARTKATKKLYVWGNLKILKNSAKEKTITPIQIEVDENVDDVVTGDHFIIALSDTGHVYSCGEGPDGQLGHGGMSNNNNDNDNDKMPITFSDKFMIIKSLADSVMISSISAGDRHVVASTNFGDIISWGYGGDGRLGLGDTISRYEPTAMTYFKDNKIVIKEFQCGSDFNIFLSEDKSVYTCGAGQQGQLGHGDNNNQLLPTTVKSLRKQRIDHVFAGGRSGFALTQSGELYLSGWGDASMLFLSFAEAIGSSLTPQQSHQNNKFQAIKVLTSQNTKISRVRAGMSSIMAITQDGYVYSWGFGSFGKLGNNSTDNQSTPSLLGTLKKECITDVALSDTRSYALTAQGDIYCFGDNSQRLLGLEVQDQQIVTPTRIPQLSGVRKIVSNNNWTIAIYDTWKDMTIKSINGTIKEDVVILKQFLQTENYSKIHQYFETADAIATHLSARQPGKFLGILKTSTGSSTKAQFIKLSKHLLEFGMGGKSCPVNELVSDVFIISNFGKTDIKYYAKNVQTSHYLITFHPQEGKIKQGQSIGIEVNAILYAPSILSCTCSIIIENDAYQFVIVKLAGKALNKNPWEIDIKEITFEKEIGRGASARVYKGTCFGTPAAIKKLEVFHMNHDAYGSFMKEVQLFSTLHHPNVVLFMGACLQSSSNMCIVMEYLDRGSLYGIIHGNGGKGGIDQLSNAFIHKALLDTARGMLYLHKLQIIHRDLKSINLLVSREGVVKVADFGLSRYVTMNKTMTGNVGTPRWIAPEVFKKMSYSTTSDVYSFGMVIYELVSRKVPYDNLNAPWEISQAIMNHVLPDIPSTCPRFLRDLMIRTWELDPLARPTFDKIVTELEQIKNL